MKKRVLSVVLALLFCLALPVTALANAAEPPRLSVLVLNPPKDLQLSLVFTLEDEAQPVKAEGTRLAWEGYYLFRPASFPDLWDGETSPEGLAISLRAETNGEAFSIPVDKQALMQGIGTYYNNLCVLDLSAQPLTPGAYPWQGA